MAVAPTQGYRRQLGPGQAAPRAGASPEAYGAGVGQAIERVGAEWSEDDLRAERLELQRRMEAEAARSGKDYAQLELDVDEMVEQVRAQNPGEAVGHAETIEQRVNERLGAFLGTIQNDRVRQAFEAQGDNLLVRTIGRERAWAGGQRAGYQARMLAEQGRIHVGQLSRGFNQQQLDAFNQSIAVTADMMTGIPANNRAEAVFALQRDNVRASLNVLQLQDPQRLIGLIEQGTYNRFLTEGDIDTLRQGGVVEIRRQENARQELVNQQRAELREDIGIIQAQIRDGIPVDDATLERLQQAAGTAQLDRQEYDVGVTRIRNLTNRDLRGRRPEWVEGEINRLSALGDDISPDDAVRLDQLKARQEAHAEEFRRNPGGFASSNGDRPPPVDWANPSQEALQGRRRWARRTWGNSGQQTGIYTSEEAATRTALLDDGTAARAELAAMIVRDAGDDGGLIQATARQVAPRDEPFQMALRLGTLPVVGPRRMRDALAGADALAANPSLWNQDKANEVIAEVAPALRWLPEATRAAIVQTTRNLYGAQASRHGHTAWNEDAYRMAFHQAVGAVGEGEGMTGGFRELRFGRQRALVTLPVGWTQARFEAAWFGITPQAAVDAANGVPVRPDGRTAITRNEFLGMVPVPVANGRYILWTGSGFVGRRGGGRYMIDVGRLPRGRGRAPVRGVGVGRVF